MSKKKRACVHSHYCYISTAEANEKEMNRVQSNVYSKNRIHNRMNMWVTDWGLHFFWTLILFLSMQSSWVHRSTPGCSLWCHTLTGNVVLYGWILLEHPDVVFQIHQGKSLTMTAKVHRTDICRHKHAPSDMDGTIGKAWSETSDMHNISVIRGNQLMYLL